MAQVCIDFGGSQVKVGIASNGTLGASTDFAVTGSDADLDAVARAITELGVTPGAVDAVAVAVPGLVDAAGSRLIEAHGKYEWMLDADLATWFRDAFGADTVLENDARAALIGEVAAGAARGERDAVILVLGTGIGTAAMIGGEPVRGADGSASILGGHITIDRRGPRCNCGNVGCAEVFGGSWALPDRIRDAAARLRAHGELPQSAAAGAEHPAPLEETGPGGFADVIAAARDGDAVAAAVLADAQQAWGIVAVSLCHLFDPRTVIVAGGIARSPEVVVPPIEHALRDSLWRTLPRPRIAVSTQPALSVLRGLAAIAAPTDEESPA